MTSLATASLRSSARPVAHEDDEERALRASLRVLGELTEYADEVEAAWGLSGFGVRVGLSSGPVVLGDVGAGARIEYAAFGDAVNTAARGSKRLPNRARCSSPRRPSGAPSRCSSGESHRRSS